MLFVQYYMEQKNQNRALSSGEAHNKNMYRKAPMGAIAVALARLVAYVFSLTPEGGRTGVPERSGGSSRKA